MGIIKTVHLIYEYIRHDEEEKVAEVKRAIDGVDLEIEEGSFTAILGHNGSGKSTLAKHINGLFAAYRGNCMGRRDRYKGRGSYLGCPQNSRNGLSKS